MADRSKFEVGISDEQLLEILPRLLELQQSPAFRLYLELVKAGQIQAREFGFDQGKDLFDYFKGMIEGMGQARFMVDTLVQRASDLVKREKAGPKRQPEPDPRDMESDTSF